LVDAERYHHERKRKGGDVPYVSHLLAVCSLVLEGGTETEAMAAIARDYGPEVAAIVEHCSDAAPARGERKAPWMQRKQDYIERMRAADASTLLVSAADKLHNLRAIHADCQAARRSSSVSAPL
jgi:(p)ppGpp synthase/HD superfamily hydrolase